MKIKVKYKFSCGRFDISPRYNETVNCYSPDILFDYFTKWEKQLSNPEVTLHLQDENKTKVCEMWFNDTLIWNYRNGFTHDWELFKLAQEIKQD